MNNAMKPKLLPDFLLARLAGCKSSGQIRRSSGMSMTLFLLLLAALFSPSNANAVGDRIQLLSPERQIFVPFTAIIFDQPSDYKNLEGRYLSWEIDRALCREYGVSSSGRAGTQPCDWLTKENLSQNYLDVVFAQDQKIKAYQRVVTFIQYQADEEIRIVPRLFRKTDWTENFAFSNHRFRIDNKKALPLHVDRYQILKAARHALLSEEDIKILSKCKSSNDGPCSTGDEPEFKIEEYKDNMLRRAFIVRIKNLKDN
jgi:hypothetical protein